LVIEVYRRRKHKYVRISGSWVYKVVSEIEFNKFRRKVKYCVECGARLRVDFYQNSDKLRELVCPVCGLVHAVFGASFYEVIQNKIFEISQKDRDKKFRVVMIWKPKDNALVFDIYDEKDRLMKDYWLNNIEEIEILEFSTKKHKRLMVLKAKSR